MKSLVAFAIATAALSGLQGQTLDSSGNSMLKGAYRFRQVAVVNIDQNGNPTETAAAYGVITFDGNGKYTVTNATSVDNMVSNGSPQNLTANGTYVIGGNGIGYIANPLAPTDNTNLIYGATAQGPFIGSATEGSINDLFIAIPAGTPPTNGSFNAAYWAGSLDFTGGTSTAIKNALFKLSPNGQGGFGTITFNGQASNQSASSITQTTTGATYAFQSDGSGNLTLPLPSGVSAANALVTGNRTIFLSADGNFMIGYTPTGYDIWFGALAVNGNGSTSMYKGLYFLGGLEDAPQGNGVDSFYGASSSDGQGNQVFHERVNSPFFYPYDYGTDNSTTINADGSTMVDFNGYTYGFGVSGKAFVGVGTSGFFSLITGIQAPTFSGSGVYLNPTGVVNAASYAPITASLAPGELITLYGTNLAGTTTVTAGGQPFPTVLGNVQVLINNTQAPIYYISPTQLSVIVPYGISSASIATIQVNNNGTLSNTVTMFISDSAPGAFTQTQNGIGFAAAVRQNGTLITPSNPAQRGEYISVYLTGLGTVTPTIQDGAIGPTSTLSNSDLWKAGNLSIFFNDYTNGQFGVQGTIQYAGLAPGLAGLYQINVQIPNTVGPATNPGVYMEFSTDAADVNQVQIAVGASSTANVEKPQIRGQVTRHRPHSALRNPQSPKANSRVGVQ
jgi:uncharacterized protein (TIGR03437 family)